MNNSNSNNQTQANERIFNLIIVDESGSMQSIYNQAFNGMNQTISTIKEKANAIENVTQLVTLITFDSQNFKQHMVNCPAQNARLLKHDEYRPYACTPLYDAIGRSVSALEAQVSDNDAVLVTIITDGMENASKDFTSQEIKRLIERLSAKGWIFTYIGANQDVMMEAGNIGIDQYMDFDASPCGTEEMWVKEKKARLAHYDKVNDARKQKGWSVKQIFKSMNISEDKFFEN